MNTELIFIHGRSQQMKDALKLKDKWISTWRSGLHKSGLELPENVNIRFPYYGDTLYQLSKGRDLDSVAEIVVKGISDEGEDPEYIAFVQGVLNEFLWRLEISPSEVFATNPLSVTEKGVLNWKWVRSILVAIDSKVRGGSGTAVALATKDVYLYLKNTAYRDKINSGVLNAFVPGAKTVVVSHSLGTIIAYDILRNLNRQTQWDIPLFVTLGSPLGVTEVKANLAPIAFPPTIENWYNAMDPQDFVSLYPLDEKHFGVKPSIENYTNVDNQTDNQHGIEGYLNDAEVAKKIYDALQS